MELVYTPTWMVDLYCKLVGKYTGKFPWIGHGLLTTLDLWSFKQKVLNMNDAGAHVCILVNFNVPREDSGIQSKPPDSVAKYLFFLQKNMQLSMVGSFFWRKTSANIFGKCSIKGPQTKSWNLSSRYDLQLLKHHSPGIFAPTVE